MAHNDASRCSYASAWSYVVTTGDLKCIVSSTVADPKQATPMDDLSHPDSIPASLLHHLAHYYRQDMSPPPVQYCDGSGRFVLILPTAQRDGRGGFTCICHDDHIACTEADLDLLHLLSESLIDRFHALEYRRSMQVEVRRREKQRIARDLHDTIVQEATGADLHATLSLTEVSTGTDEARHHVKVASGLTRSVVKQLRQLIWSLHGNHDELEAADAATKESFVQR
jgi:signal transduction histidine kinase